MPNASKSSAHLTTSILTGGAILVVTLLLVVVIFKTEPKPEREAATKITPMLVATMPLEFGEFMPQLRAVGEVVPARQVSLRALVAGEVTELAAPFVPGQLVKRGTLLARIDARDYENALARAQAQLTQAQAALQIEMGEQEVARKEYQRLAKNLTPMQTDLVMRKPQLATAQAAVAAARAALAEAQLNVERTQISAPFNAQVIERSMDEGSLVTVGADLGRLVGTDSYWVEATLPLSQLEALLVPEVKVEAAPQNAAEHPGWVQITARGERSGATRVGRVHSIIGAVDDQSRLARVLIELVDPLALTESRQGRSAVYLGEFVDCLITTRPLAQVVRIPREYLRKNDTVWLMQENALVIQPVTVAFRDAAFVYVRAGLRAGQQLVTTDLARVRDGAPLRLAGEVGSD